jgi:Skp family chaperone for outer membrane proteins
LTTTDADSKEVNRVLQDMSNQQRRQSLESIVTVEVTGFDGDGDEPAPVYLQPLARLLQTLISTPRVNMSMISKTAAAGVASLLCAAAAHAAAPAPAAGAASFGGPSIPGVCLLSQQAVFANAKVGQAASARLQQLAQQQEAALAPERTSLENDAKTLEGQRSTLPAAQFQQRQQALAERAQAFQSKVQRIEQQVQATRNKALQTVSQDEQPVAASVYKAHGCGVLFSRDSVLAGGQGMDLTADVVKGLDASITTITFDLEPPPAQPAGR